MVSVTVMVGENTVVKRVVVVEGVRVVKLNWVMAVTVLVMVVFVSVTVMVSTDSVLWITVKVVPKLTVIVSVTLARVMVDCTESVTVPITLAVLVVVLSTKGTNTGNGTKVVSTG